MNCPNCNDSLIEFDVRSVTYNNPTYGLECGKCNNINFYFNNSGDIVIYNATTINQNNLHIYSGAGTRIYDTKTPSDLGTHKYINKFFPVIINNDLINQIDSIIKKAKTIILLQ